MRILDRYILRKFLTTFLFVVLIMLIVIVTIDLTEKLDKFAKHDLSFIEVLKYYRSYIPFIAGLCKTFRHHKKDNEDKRKHKSHGYLKACTSPALFC